MKKKATTSEFIKVFEQIKKSEPSYKAYVLTERKHLEKFGSRRYDSFNEFINDKPLTL